MVQVSTTTMCLAAFSSCGPTKQPYAGTRAHSLGSRHTQPLYGPSSACAPALGEDGRKRKESSTQRASAQHQGSRAQGKGRGLGSCSQIGSRQGAEGHLKLHILGITGYSVIMLFHRVSITPAGPLILGDSSSPYRANLERGDDATAPAQQQSNQTGFHSLHGLPRPQRAGRTVLRLLPLQQMVSALQPGVLSFIWRAETIGSITQK